jgi:predicted O-methyltransferase YrrM
MKQLIRRSIAYALTKLPRGILVGKEHAGIFQRAGFHIVRDHFYEPIPNTEEIDQNIWERPSAMPGVNTNLDGQLGYLRDTESYIAEYQSHPTEPDFDGIDGAMLYAAVRKFRPSHIIEVGAGLSTLISLQAIERNGIGRITSIDPFPPSYLTERPSFTLMQSKVEHVPLSTFEALAENDILFIDSSHVVRIGGDVIYEILEILPRLKPGVVIHIHDIFFPNPYPKVWTIDYRRFWTEQYLVQAFLAFNNCFQILWSSSMMETYKRDKVLSRFPKLGYSSLWLRRMS